MNPIIRYTLSSGTGRFLCSIKAEEFDKNCSCGWKKVVSLNIFWRCDKCINYYYIG